MQLPEERKLSGRSYFSELPRGDREGVSMMVGLAADAICPLATQCQQHGFEASTEYARALLCQPLREQIVATYLKSFNIVVRQLRQLLEGYNLGYFGIQINFFQLCLENECRTHCRYCFGYTYCPHLFLVGKS